MIRHTQEDAISTLDIISHSAAQTQRLGMRLGELLQGGELLLLNGQLGTGKTTFTQGLASGMGISEIINSPTFTLLKEYAGRTSATTQNELGPVASRQQPRQKFGPPLYHFDLYRLDNPEEILDLGFDDYFFSTGVCVVEWADKADLLWPTEHIRIRMKMLSETKRGIVFTATSRRYAELLHQFQKNTYATTSS